MIEIMSRCRENVGLARSPFIPRSFDCVAKTNVLHPTLGTEVHDRWLRELGDVTYDRIEVAPFAVERFGTTFGLVLRDPEEEDDPWAIEMQPGNYMAFFEPWDSGDYDT